MGCAGARVWAQLGLRGVCTTALAERHQDGPLACPVPSSAQGQTKLALDVVTYSNGDAAHGTILDVDLPDRAEPADPLEDVRTLTTALPESLAVRNPPSLLRMLLGLANRETDHLVRPAAGAPELTPIAVTLAGEFGDALARANRLRTPLDVLLGEHETGQPRPPIEVLRTLVASADERALALVALAASPGLPSGLASSRTKLYALVRVKGRWYVLQGSAAEASLTLQPLSPPNLPGVLVVLPVPSDQAAPLQPTIPHLLFLEEFLPCG